jgi:DNA-binding MarR family transcriptional regulator
MHAVFFGLKRAYYATLGLTRRTLKKMGLTAARMDLMYLVNKTRRGPTPQSALWRTLGVVPSVVSRMLKRLEELDYVKRTVNPYDKRELLVTLTIKGRARIRRAIRRFIQWGYAQLALHSVLEPQLWHSPWRTHVAVSRALEFLRLIRVGFGDGASLVVYPHARRDDKLPLPNSAALHWGLEPGP